MANATTRVVVADLCPRAFLGTPPA